MDSNNAAVWITGASPEIDGAVAPRSVRPHVLMGLPRSLSSAARERPPVYLWRAAATAVITAILSAQSLAQAAPAPAATAEARARAAIARIEAVDEQYRAVIAIDPMAIATARSLDRQRRAPGLLQGEPILLKDNIESVGLPTTAGSLALAANDTGRDADLVAALRSEGAVILGKANLSEWANFRSEHSSSGWSGVGGQTRNAVDPDRSPCGSSSGSAVAVALNYVDVAIGTETSGSIVCPAAVNGVIGFKPTQGLVSGAGIVPLALTQDTAGPIADNVALAARTLAVIASPDVPGSAEIRRGLLQLDAPKSLRGLRIGIFANTQGYDPRRDHELERSLERLSAAGAVLVPGLRITPYEDYGKDSYDVLLWEFRRDINAYLAGLPNDLRALNLENLIAFNDAHSEQELRYFDQSIFLQAQAIADSEEVYARKRAATRAAMRDNGLDRLFSEHRLDALIGITNGPAWLIDRVNGDAFFGPGMAGPAAVAGNPHITLPLGEIEGLPLGISLVGERWKDHHLATIAHLLEAASAGVQAGRHSPWSELLAACVVATPDGHGTAVDYDCFSSHRADLAAYLDSLASVSRDDYAQWTGQEQLAFLINAYNAWTVDLILSSWPALDSIRDLGSLLRSPWQREFVPLLGETLSLDDIEHGLIRKPGAFDDPRIHFAVNCASIGCPALRREAYTGELLEAQLEDQTARFLADPSRNRFEDGRLLLSPLFKWYRADFERGWRNTESVAAFVARYASALVIGPAQATALSNGDVPVEFLAYDWSLNASGR